ncbi:MAG TPA: GIY-YIG nuclease family protein [Tepidisphaeraceae bacterium]|nr:GIY-YIG nuclease family protein [Tepidisphaeraceae bacterium]
MLGLLELLRARGLDTSKRVKLIRHQDQRFDPAKLERDGLFDVYQSYQAKPVFECDLIVSFIGMENSRARLQGVYRVGQRSPATDRPLPQAYVEMGLWNPDGHFYELDRLTGFEDVEGRVVIDWGKGTLAWHQWLSEKEVIEVLPTGYVRDFPGYLDFVITHDELVRIVNHRDAHREWHRMLSAVAGVYLIVDGRTGRQYVGSAYGQSGILGRWGCYADTGHGGNVQLRELVAADPTYAKDFSFTVLRTLPRTLTRAEVIGFEGLYKRKLGSRAFGLNSN